ncbi:hypothetical protein VNO77_10134 [Canavalia gladiata]|uniref:Uncharacterized protein n=1 Tax=Canavalia gladiata TaxID=3824 RepID=A0AAN9MFI5_CANGL
MQRASFWVLTRYNTGLGTWGSHISLVNWGKIDSSQLLRALTDGSLYMVTVFSDSNSKTSHPSLQSGFPPEIAEFHFRQFRPLPPIFKCSASVDPWRDSVDFEFRLSKIEKVRGLGVSSSKGGML